MPSIKITDATSASANVTLLDTSVLGTTPLSIIHFTQSDVVNALSRPLDHVQLSTLSLGFGYQPSFSLAGGSAKFTGGVAPGGELDLVKPPADGKGVLFSADQFGRNVAMGQNYYLAMSLNLVASASPAGTVDSFALTLPSSATATARLHHPFPPAADGSYPTLETALENLFSAFSLPSAAGHLAMLPVGSVFTFDCAGSLAFSTSLNLLAAISPTASPGFSSTAGPVSVTATPSITVGGGFTLAGEYQVRLWKRDDHTFELGYYKKQGSTFKVTFEAAESGDVTLGGVDVLAKLYALLGDNGKLPAAWLKANIPPVVADGVSAAYKAAVQTKLSLEFDAECDASLTDQSAFSWTFDLSAGSSAQTALLDALHGDVAPLLTGPLPPGVTAVGSILSRVRDSKRVFTFNFLGLFDYASIEDVAKSFSAKASDDGQLILTDEAHLKRLSADATPFLKAAPLQSVMAEDCAATVGYAVSFGHFVPSLTFTYSYFTLKSNARPDDLSLFLAIAGQLSGADVEQPWTQILASGARSQTASLLAALNYGVTTAKAIFLNADESPRTVPAFSAVGRRALLAEPGLALNPTFVHALGDDAAWQKILLAGSPDNVYLALGADATDPPKWAKDSYDWIVHIKFWAAAMNAAAQALESISIYLQQNPGIDPVRDSGFTTRRQALVNKLANAIKNTPMFNDSLGILTIFETARPAQTSVTIAYTGKTSTY